MASQKSTYFPQYGGALSEQGLAQDLVDEHIKIHGSTVYYLPRSLNNVDNLFHEDTISSFESSMQIEMYLKSYEKFDGMAEDIVTKFGMRNNDALTFIVSKRRWQQEFDGNFPGKLADDRPTEGDIIYFPLTKGLFEIKFVEHQAPFYQLGEFYTYELKCELFEYSNEDFNTGIQDIDDIELDRKVKITLVMDPNELNNAIDFQVGEQVVGSTSLSDAEVVSWNAQTGILVVMDAKNSFKPPETITGQDSTASWTMKVPTISGSQQIETQYIADDPVEYIYNRTIEAEADNLLDFTEGNPFGEY